MSGSENSQARSSAVGFSARALRRLGCVRLDEVIVLQGPPIVGLAFAAGHVSGAQLLPALIMIVASMLQVAHAFVVNDIAGWETDLGDPRRQHWSMASRGVTRVEMRWFALRLLAYAAILSLLLGPVSLVLCCVTAVLSLAYSGAGLFWKNVPGASTTLHLLGGATHFLFGHAALASLDGRALVLSLFFGLVFAAGHFMHEVRDHAVDAINGIRTNAVAYGRRQAFIAGMFCFALALLHVVVLASVRQIPTSLLWVGGLLPLHLIFGFAVLRAGLPVRLLLAYQKFYRFEFAMIGIAFVTAVPIW
jgi:4-hydroxybenzoate polyprenyltransferase